MRFVVLGLSAALLTSMTSAGHGQETKLCPRPGTMSASFLTQALAQIRQSDAHDELFSNTKVLPAATTIDLRLRREADSSTQYYAIAEGNAHQVGIDWVVYKKAPDDDRQTIITMWLPSDLGGLWQEGNVHVIACKRDALQYVASVYLPTSSPLYSSAVWAVVGLFYTLAAFAVAVARGQRSNWFRYLNPIVLTAGPDGKGSLSNLQVLFFSVIVVGLVAYIVARAGVLSSLSPAVLALIGIAGGGAAFSQATDTNRNRVSFENWSWFIRKGWLPPNGVASVNEAKWTDILTTDGQFDVYRFQSATFSLAVGAALLAHGFTDLGTFDIPNTLLGVLALSQVIYIAGKMASPTSIKELNDATIATRDAEREFIVAANKVDLARPPIDLVDAIRRAGPDKYADYIGRANNLKIMFFKVFGINVRDDLIQPILKLI